MCFFILSRHVTIAVHACLRADTFWTVASAFGQGRPAQDHLRNTRVIWRWMATGIVQLYLGSPACWDDYWTTDPQQALVIATVGTISRDKAELPR
jgi:hypothetical protein